MHSTFVDGTPFCASWARLCRRRALQSVSVLWGAMSPKLPAPTRSPEAPVEETAAAVRNVMASDDGSETPDAEVLSIGNHAMAAQGLRQTDVRA